jgi:hypothetical protein
MSPEDQDESPRRHRSCLNEHIYTTQGSWAVRERIYTNRAQGCEGEPVNAALLRSSIGKYVDW